jgi:tetratricopeptide (TPR) repeat protein
MGLVLAVAWPGVREGAGQDDGVRPGFADADETGTLPAETTELAKRAAAAVSRKDWGSAKAAYQEMLGAEPDNALALANLGVVEFQLGELEAARTHLERAVHLRPKLASCWTTLGLLYFRQDELDLATAALSYAVHHDPANPQAHNYLAVVAKARGWTNAAELELQKAIDLDPDYAEAHFNLALLFAGRQPPALEIARRHYTRALALGAAPDPLLEEKLDPDPEG